MHGVVLIATDFGSDSELVARRGVGIAHALCAHVVLLHVCAFPPPSPSSFYPEASRAIYEQAMLDLRRLASVCELDASEVTLLVRSGHAGAAIRDTAHELAASMVVIGTRRQSRLERWLVGSVAESVARGAGCSVLVIPFPTTRAARHSSVTRAAALVDNTTSPVSQAGIAGAQPGKNAVRPQQRPATS